MKIIKKELNENYGLVNQELRCMTIINVTEYVVEDNGLIFEFVKDNRNNEIHHIEITNKFGRELMPFFDKETQKDIKFAYYHGETEHAVDEALFIASKKMMESFLTKFFQENK